MFIPVMRGLDPRIHVFLTTAKSWMAGTSPAMTIERVGRATPPSRLSRIGFANPPLNDEQIIRIEIIR
jgi:hypothetical protein